MHSNELQEFNRAVSLANSGQSAQAQNILSQLRRVYPDDPDVLVWLAYTAPELKAARAAIEDARRFNPSHRAVIQAQEWLRQQESWAYQAPTVSAPPPPLYNSGSAYPTNPPTYNPNPPLYNPNPAQPFPPNAPGQMPPGYTRSRRGLEGFVDLQQKVYNRQLARGGRRRTGRGGCVAVFFVLIGLVLGGAAFYFYQTNQAYLSKGEVATAIVTKNRLSSGKNGSYYPTFKFQTKTGATVEVESTFGSSPASYSVGQHVQIYYKPENPRDFRANDFENIWLLPAILGSIGGFMLLIGLASVLRPARSSRGRRRYSGGSEGGDDGGSDWSDSDSGSGGSDWGGGDRGGDGGGGDGGGSD